MTSHPTSWIAASSSDMAEVNSHIECFVASVVTHGTQYRVNLVVTHALLLLRSHSFVII